MIEGRSESLIGDKAYDSNQLDKAMRAHGTEMTRTTVPPGATRHRSVADCVCISDAGSSNDSLEWLKWQRRLLVCWEYYPTNFSGFAQFADLCILLRQY